MSDNYDGTQDWNASAEIESLRMKKWTYRVVIDVTRVYEQYVTVETEDDDLYTAEALAGDEIHDQIDDADPEKHGWDYIETHYDVVDLEKQED